jgi:hypothetical protein
MLHGRPLNPLFRYSRRLFGRQATAPTPVMETKPEAIDNMVGYWREMADETLAIAEEMKDAENKWSMLEIAAGYELLANGADLRGARTE